MILQSSSLQVFATLSGRQRAVVSENNWPFWQVWFIAGSTCDYIAAPDLPPYHTRRYSPGGSFPRARFLSLAPSKLRLCLANHRAGYLSNLACDWLSIVWAYSKQETENGPRTTGQKEPEPGLIQPTTLLCIGHYHSCWCSGPQFNIKMSSYKYKTVMISYIHNGISYTGKKHLYIKLGSWLLATPGHQLLRIWF